MPNEFEKSMGYIACTSLNGILRDVKEHQRKKNMKRMTEAKMSQRKKNNGGTNEKRVKTGVKILLISLPNPHVKDLI